MKYLKDKIKWNHERISKVSKIRLEKVWMQTATRHPKHYQETEKNSVHEHSSNRPTMCVMCYKIILTSPMAYGCPWGHSEIHVRKIIKEQQVRSDKCLLYTGTS